MNTFLLSRFSVKPNQNITGKFCALIAIMLLVFPHSGFAQTTLFNQNFNSSTSLATYISATPTTGQFTAINSSGGATASITTLSAGNNALLFSRAAGTTTFSRIADFTPTPAAIKYSFTLATTSSAATLSVAQLKVGQGFSNAVTPESNANTYARLAIDYGTSSGDFRLRDVGTGAISAVFSGTQTVTWVMNNTGASISYLAPNGSGASVANDKMDVWIGITNVFNDITVTTPGDVMTDLKFILSSGTGTITFDDMSITTIVPSILTCAPDPAPVSVTGSCTALVTVTTPTITGTCTPGTTFINDWNGTNNASDFYPIGITTVLWTVTDGCGGVYTCTNNVTVTDDEDPVITCPFNSTQSRHIDGGACTYTIQNDEFDYINVTDNCTGSIIPEWSLAGATTENGVSTLAGTFLNKGITQVTWTATDESNNSSSCTFNIIIIGPTATITGNTTICNGQSANLSIAFTGTTPWTFQINGGPSVTTSDNPKTISVSPSATTAYTVTSLSDGVPCTAVASDLIGTATVTVNPRPTASLSGSQTICNGQSASISIAVTGSGTISGTLSGGIPFSGTAPTIIAIVSPVVTTVYIVTTLSDANCTAIGADLTGSYTVNVIQHTNDWYVNDGSTSGDVYTFGVGNDANPGTRCQPFATMQKAIDEATAGDIIFVDNGDYAVTTAINITKEIDIRGAAYGSAGTSSARPHESNLNDTRAAATNAGALTISTTSTVSLDGFTFNGSKIITGQPANATVRFKNNRMFLEAMPVSGQTNMIWSIACRLTLANNYFETNGSNPSNSAVMQVAGGYTGAGTTDSMTVTNNTFLGIPDGSSQSTLQLNFSDCQGTVAGNTFDAVDLGVLIAGSSGNMTVSGNNFKNQTRGALEIASASYAAGVLIFNPNYTGPVTISGNTFQNSDCGIRSSNAGGTETGTNIQISTNIFTGNLFDVVHKYPTATLTLDGDNTLAGTTITSATLSDLFNMEDKIAHKVDVAGFGLVIVKANNIYVTPNSFLVAAGTTSPSVQRGVDAASASYTVHVQTGNYTGQVEISKDLTVIGEGIGNTNIISSNVLPLFFTTSANNHPVIYVHDAANVAVRNLTVDGAGKGNANNRMVGFGYSNAGGTVRDCEIKDVRNTPIDGVQAGNGILAFSQSGTARTLNFIKNDIHDFQKNATVFAGNDLTANVDSNIITGAGNVAFIAQNGIQISSGATGSVRYNTVSGFSYTPATAVSCGVLIFGTSGSILTSNNTVNNSQLGINYFDASGSISNNLVNYDDMGTTPYWYGIDVEDGATTVSANEVNGGGNGAGIEADAASGETTTTSIQNNTVDNTDEGLVAWSETGGTLSSPMNNNSITNSASFAIHNYGAATQDGTCNWYGSGVPATVAAEISGPVTYIPYRSDGTDGSASIGFQPTSACGACTITITSISKTDATCQDGSNGSATANISGAVGTPTYLWSDGQTTQTATGLLDGGSYAVTVTDVNGCTASSSTIIGHIFSNSADPTSASASPSTICNGQSTMLTLTGGGGGNNQTIHWYAGSCGGISVGTGNGLVINPETTTTYYGRYENGAPCLYSSACASVTVIVNTLPSATITPSGTTTVCKGDAVIFQANTGVGLTYQWTNTAGNIIGATNSSYTTSVKSTYKVIVTNANGCSKTSAGAKLKNFPAVSVKITNMGSLNICTTGSVTLKAKIVAGYTFQWYKDNTTIPGATGTSYIATVAGAYKYLATSSDGCTKFSATKNVTDCKSGFANDSEPIPSLMLYPNPSDGTFVIDLQLQTSEEVKATMEVVNLLGQIILQEEIPVTDGAINETVHLSKDVAAGMYLVNVIVGDHVFTSQLMINR